MKPIRVFRHLGCEGPGYLAEIIQRHGLNYELVAVDEGATIPADCDDVSAMVFLGGPMSVNDPLPWVEQELALIRSAQAKGLPMLGVCLGSQLLTKALGGRVFRGEQGQEIGWHPLHAVDSEHSEKWLQNMPLPMMAFHWHGETFELPEGASTVLSSEAYKNQAFVIGKTLGLQFHLEMQAEMVKEWTALYTDDLAQGGRWNMDAVKIIGADLEPNIEALHKLADSLFSTWLKGLLV